MKWASTLYISLLLFKICINFLQLKYVVMNIQCIPMTLQREADHQIIGPKSQHGRLDPLHGGVAITVLNSTHRAFTEDPVAQVPNPHPLTVTITIAWLLPNKSITLAVQAHPPPTACHFRGVQGVGDCLPPQTNLLGCGLMCIPWSESIFHLRFTRHQCLSIEESWVSWTSLAWIPHQHICQNFRCHLSGEIGLQHT